ncbi:hypothetical protein MLD63_16710 [Paracoccus sp. TK19116]|uniref:Uncharacterized protein n=1 Tax=Paracoccus albicereus TaxID=2922394 RepID=A0ABT1MUV0_9RHOB|nr:hypothetical protein [Paracoccus albicereus]MCQ0972062.1 hypothetical protein [Paracoccus albicereus]
MDDCDDSLPPRLADPTDLQQRLSSSDGAVTLTLTAQSDTDEIEAFLIAVFDVTRSLSSYREQNALMRQVISQLDEANTIVCAGCNVEVILDPHNCEMRHDLPAVSLDLIAFAMLEAFSDLTDPAGMIVSGFARIWESPSIEAAHRLTSASQHH